MTGVECAIHMAAIPSVPRSVQEPRRARRPNVDATRALLLAARDAGVRRVVLASSSSVYGESSALPNREALRPADLHCPGSGRADHQHRRRRSSVGERRVRDAAADHRRIGHAALRRTSAGRRTAFAGRRVARPRSAGLRSRRAGRRRTAANGRLAAGADRMTFGHLAGADTHEARLENQRHLKMAVPSPFTAVAPSRQGITK